MQQFQTVSSSAGVNADTGKMKIHPDSVLTYTSKTGVHKSLVADSVGMLLNPLWEYNVSRVMLPVQRIFDHVPIAPPLIRVWLKSSDSKIGGLTFPQPHLDVGSKIPKIHINKHDPTTKLSEPSIVLLVDIDLYVFCRDLDPSPELQPFDPAVWNPVMYGEWLHLCSSLTPMAEAGFHDTVEGCPVGGGMLFRRMMRTHFEDFGLIFGSRIWSEFGLGEMVQTSGREFMRTMLLGMYHSYNSDPLRLPPLSNVYTIKPGQRVCGKCMIFKLGRDQMMRCPCQQVYYCSKACQKQDWKTHSIICSAKKKAT